MKGFEEKNKRAVRGKGTNRLGCSPAERDFKFLGHKGRWSTSRMGLRVVMRSL